MTAPTRVAIFTDNDFGKVTGVTTTLQAVLAHAPSDIQPRIFTAADVGCDRPDYLALASTGLGIPFYREMKMYVPQLRSYLGHVRAHETSILHLTTPGPLGLAALWIAGRTGLPMVGSFHTDLAAYSRILSGSPRLGYWLQQYMRWMYGHCERVLVPSHATGVLLASARMRTERIAIWPRGVDTNLFSPAKRSTSLRDRWGASDERPALLYVGRLSREKGLDMLPDIQAGLRAKGVAHRLIVAGDGPLRDELERRCDDAIFTGALGRDAIAEVFASADAFVFPSRTDTAGNVVLEAQASGLPVLVSSAGGPRENMRDGRTGVVCRDDAPATWVDAVRLVLQRDARPSMRGAAREYALTRRWQTALEPLYRSYRDVAGQGADLERRIGAA
jgi:glycosyltransferase involved in cell wall biosynthesis